MKFKRRSVQFSEIQGHQIAPVPIVADGGLATRGVGEGRIIPVVIIDTSERPDIEELVRVHEYLGPGDATFQWGQINWKLNTFDLVLQFKRPAEINLVLSFDVDSQGGLVDQIMTSNAMYIQPGIPGDRLSSTLESPKVLVELPETGAKQAWDRVHLKSTTKQFRDKGLSRQRAKAAARAAIEEWRRFGSQRAGRNRP